HKHFYWVVTGLFMNIYRARIIRCPGIIQPKIIRKPAIRPRLQDKIPGALMIDMSCALSLPIQYPTNAGKGFQKRAYLLADGRVIHIDMGDLMIGYGESLGGS